ncbi:MAG: crossover junction endodeoxyribonuclease RuvC [Spirochaetia bacterium]|jgi:crossover junction endodeoxyribonuclease RuvC|nr:crossover junction endodeoxyribonuclease RuvC [Spirochaetales bacterium]MDX9783674.1 crossover junction endodeoxyribonuclease RuvC [Spirochaetia bacterium]
MIRPAKAGAETIVIGIDPGLAFLGYGLIALAKGGLLRHVAHGCIRTSPSDPSELRLQQIFSGVRDILENYKPQYGGIEDLYFFRNVSSALPVAEARGIIKLAFYQASVPLAEFTPNAIKKAVTGTARADKNQVQEMVRILLGLSEPPKPDHAADALAAAVCRAHFEGPAGLGQI